MKPNFTNYNQSVVKQSLTAGANDKSTIKQSLTVETADDLRDALAVELAEIGSITEEPPSESIFITGADLYPVQISISAKKWGMLCGILQKHGITAERAEQVKGGAE